MNGPLDEQYFVWLYSTVFSTGQRQKSKTYWNLLSQLYEKEYIWILSGDRNRATDGQLLRKDFVISQNLPPNIADRNWMELGCSVLEMMLGLSRRMSFLMDQPVDQCFWELMNNLGLTKCTDISNYDPVDVDLFLDKLIWREYSYSGYGGLFPLNEPQEDQRHVEIWYQLQAYVLERM